MPGDTALFLTSHPNKPGDIAHIARSLLAIPINQSVFDAGHVAHVRDIEGEQCIPFDGMLLHAPAGVYKPVHRSSTRFFVDHFAMAGLVNPRPGQTLCDVGCGTGAIGLTAARLGWTVTGTDIDQVAIEAARRNASANGLEGRFQAIQGNLLSAVGDQQFDVIVFNEPLYDGADMVLSLSAEGSELHERFLREAREHIKPGGMILFAIANCSTIIGDLGIPHGSGWTEPRVIALDFVADACYTRALVSAHATDHR